jgi:hypothetical protein
MRAQAPAIPAPAAAVSLPFTSAEGMIFIDVTVDGHSYHMLFDTGSAFTHIGRSTGPVIRRRGPGLHRSEAHQIQCDLAAQLPADSHRLQISHTGASAMITLVLLTRLSAPRSRAGLMTVLAFESGFGFLTPYGMKSTPGLPFLAPGWTGL